MNIKMGGLKTHCKMELLKKYQFLKQQDGIILNTFLEFIKIQDTYQQAVLSIHLQTYGSLSEKPFVGDWLPVLIF